MKRRYCHTATVAPHREPTPGRLIEIAISQSRVPQLIQVYCGWRDLRPLLLRPFGLFLQLADDGEAGHDCRDGHEADTQGANRRLRYVVGLAREQMRREADRALSMPIQHPFLQRVTRRVYDTVRQPLPPRGAVAAP
jgi:hypothetical protein